MDAVSFKSELAADHTLVVPEDVIARIPLGKTIQVVILVPENAEEQEWEQLAAAEFGAGYAESDAIYDQFSDR